MLPATLLREEMEPRAFLVRSDTDPLTEAVSVARTVKPILTSSSPRYPVLFWPGLQVREYHLEHNNSQEMDN